MKLSNQWSLQLPILLLMVKNVLCKGPPVLHGRTLRNPGPKFCKLSGRSCRDELLQSLKGTCWCRTFAITYQIRILRLLHCELCLHHVKPNNQAESCRVQYGCFQKSGDPQIIHFNWVFHCKPSILGYPYFWKHPYGKCFNKSNLLQFVLRPEPAKDRVRFAKPDEDEASFRDMNVRVWGGIFFSAPDEQGPKILAY